MLPLMDQQESLISKIDSINQFNRLSPRTLPTTPLTATTKCFYLQMLTQWPST